MLVVRRLNHRRGASFKDLGVRHPVHQKTAQTMKLNADQMQRARRARHIGRGELSCE
jgi:hypothetical protein